MIWTSPVMTSDVLPSPYVTSASTTNAPATVAWNAMDGSAGTYWESQTGVSTTNQWFKLFVGTSKVCVDTLTIKNYSNGPTDGYGLHAFTLQGCDDDSTWVDIYSGHCENDETVQVYGSLSNVTSYLYYRLRCDSSYMATDLAIREITMSGVSETIIVTSPVIATTDTFVSPTINTMFPPVLATTDTFVAPAIGMSIPVPAIATTDTFPTPSFTNKMAISIPAMSSIDNFFIPELVGLPLNLKKRFPDTQGKHISLKFESSGDEGLIIYYMRTKMRKTEALYGSVPPNTQGTRIGLKIQSVGDDALILEYMSMEMRRVNQ
jgi:hypothetical protein